MTELFVVVNCWYQHNLKIHKAEFEGWIHIQLSAFTLEKWNWQLIQVIWITLSKDLISLLQPQREALMSTNKNTYILNKILQLLNTCIFSSSSTELSAPIFCSCFFPLLHKNLRIQIFYLTNNCVNNSTESFLQNYKIQIVTEVFHQALQSILN